MNEVKLKVQCQCYRCYLINFVAFYVSCLILFCVKVLTCQVNLKQSFEEVEIQNTCSNCSNFFSANSLSRINENSGERDQSEVTFYFSPFSTEKTWLK